MNLGLSFILGFSAATVGTALPGLLNMTAVKVYHQDGRTRALWFSFGAVTIIFFQTLLAVFFARFINRNADITNLLQEISLGILLLLTVIFFYLGYKKKRIVPKKKEQIKLRSKSSRYFLGMLLSALNFFPIPYYVFISITLASYQYFAFDNTSIYAFSLATAIAAFLVFYGYLMFFDKLKTKTQGLQQNINYIIGTVTLIIALITLIKWLQN